MKSGNAPEPRIKVWRPQGFAGVEVEFFENLKDLVIKPFVLQGYELTIVLHGNPKLRFAGESYRWENVDYLFLAQHPNEIFSGDARGEQTLSVWTLRLFPEAMTSLLADLGQANTPVYFPQMTAADTLNGPLASLLEETMLSFDQASSHLERECKLLSLLHAVLKHCSDSPPPEVKLGQEHRAVSLVKEVLHAHPELDVTLDDLSSVTKLSKYHLTRVFQRDVGVSPHKYQTGLRVNRAKDRLVQGAELVDVALELNFSDQAHFTRTFKAYTQTTPGRFRRDSLES